MCESVYLDACLHTRLVSICGHPSWTHCAVRKLLSYKCWTCMCVLARRRLGWQRDMSTSTAIDYGRGASESRLTALRSWVMVEVNSFGNNLELEKRGARERRLRCVRFNAGREEGRWRERRREEIKTRAHLSLSIRAEKSNVSQVEKIQLALIKVFPSQADNNAIHLNWGLTRKLHASWCQTFYGAVPSLEIQLPEPPTHTIPSHTHTHSHRLSPPWAVLCFLPLVIAALFPRRPPFAAPQPCKT